MSERTIIEVTTSDCSKIEPDKVPCVNEVFDEAIAKMMVLQFVPGYKKQLKRLERKSLNGSKLDKCQRQVTE